MDKDDSSVLDVGTICRNVAWLYVRCVVRVLADIACVRLVLDALGVESYGIFAALAGLAGLFAFFYGTLHETFMRYLGCVWKLPDRALFRETYSASGGLTVLYALSVLALGETVGLAFLFHGLSLASADGTQVFVAYQFCLAAVVADAAGLPFSACLTAAERMDRIGIAGIVESALLLLTAVAVLLVPQGLRLVTYAGLVAGARGGVTLFYAVCAQRVVAVSPRPCFRGSRFVEMLRFAGWNVLRSVSNVVRYQGTPLLLNVRAGVSFNASWSAAMRLVTAIYLFCINFQKAYAPQVFQRWERSSPALRLRMVQWTVHRSFALMWLISLVLILYAPEALSVWLGADQPPQAVAFVRALLVHIALDSLNDPLHTAIIAYGCERRYQVVVSICQASGFAFAFAALGAGLPAWSAPVSVAVANGLSVLYRFAYLRRLMGFGMVRFAWSVFGHPCALVALSLLPLAFGCRIGSVVALAAGCCIPLVRPATAHRPCRAVGNMI